MKELYSLPDIEREYHVGWFQWDSRRTRKATLAFLEQAFFEETGHRPTKRKVLKVDSITRRVVLRAPSLHLREKYSRGGVV